MSIGTTASLIISCNHCCFEKTLRPNLTPAEGFILGVGAKIVLMQKITAPEFSGAVSLIRLIQTQMAPLQAIMDG